MSSDDLLGRSRWIRIMADYWADGVWDVDGCACAADELPISAELVARLRAWQAGYDASDALEPAHELDAGAFGAEGLAIARAVKAELTDWTVVYFDEARSGGLPTPAQESQQYEIKLEANGHPAGHDRFKRDRE